MWGVTKTIIYLYLQSTLSFLLHRQYRYLCCVVFDLTLFYLHRSMYPESVELKHFLFQNNFKFNKKVF